MNDPCKQGDPKALIGQLSRSLAGEEWKSDFFLEAFLPWASLYETEEKVRLSPLFPYGGFHDPLRAQECLHQCLCSSLERIADWALSKKRTLRIRLFLSEEIGYTLCSPTAEKKPSHTVVCALRKDPENHAPFGFFLSAFNVV